MPESGRRRRNRVSLYRRLIKGSWQEVSARDARRISLIMAVLVAIVVGTGAWELIELQNTLRQDVLRANRIVARIVARGLAAESDSAPTEDTVAELLGELELQAGPVHVF